MYSVNMKKIVIVFIVFTFFLFSCTQPYEHAQIRTIFGDSTQCHLQFLRDAHNQFLTENYNEPQLQNKAMECQQHITLFNELAKKETNQAFASLEYLQLQIDIQEQDILLTMALIEQKEKLDFEQRLYLSGCAFSVKMCVFSKTIENLNLSTNLTQTLTE